MSSSCESPVSCQAFVCVRSENEKMTAGVKSGISAGMTAHHNTGLAMSKAAATSRAATTRIRIAILSPQERIGRISTEVPFRTKHPGTRRISRFYWEW